jgi:hypothetical protein
MSTTLRASSFRLAGGAILAVAGLAAAAFLLPDASQKKLQTGKTLEAAAITFDRQVADLKQAQAEADRLRADRKALDDLMGNMPLEGVGKLHWKLSQKLFDLAAKDGVRLITVKYGAPAREASKGSVLESVDVEFSVVGVYKDLKVFMLGLEASKLPFAVVAAKLEESPDGAHLTITLRAFRQSSAPAAEPQSGEGA